MNQHHTWRRPEVWSRSDTPRTLASTGDEFLKRRPCPMVDAAALRGKPLLGFRLGSWSTAAGSGLCSEPTRLRQQGCFQQAHVPEVRNSSLQMCCPCISRGRLWHVTLQWLSNSPLLLDCLNYWSQGPILPFFFFLKKDYFKLSGGNARL